MARKSKSLIVDDSTFQKRARRLAKLLQVDERQFVREQGGLLARDVAKYTPPYATFPSKGKSTIGSKKDFDEGRGSIVKDMLLNFRITDQSYIDHIYDITGTTKNIRRTLRNKKGKQYLVDVDRLNLGSVSEAVQWHNSRRRKSDGRAMHRGKAGGNDPKIGRWKNRDIMWVNQDIFNKAKKQLIKNVGISKAGPAKAALQLGAKGSIPLPVKKQLGRVKASGRMAQTSKGPYAMIRASGSRSPGLAHVQHLMPMIMRDRLIKAVKRLRYMKRQTVKRTGFKN